MKAQKVKNPENQIKQHVQKRIRNDMDIQNAYLLVHSESKNIHWDMHFHKNHKDIGNSNQPYHIASIGKTFTSVIIGMLADQGRLKVTDPIDKYLGNDVIDKIHIYKGIDYSKRVTIHHLLNHTSGIADIFMDKSTQGANGLDLMLTDTNHFWEPTETIEWTKENLSALFIPGKKFHYSDTNYQLLGLIIENITGMPLHEAYTNFISKPLGMESTWLHLFQSPRPENARPMAPVYIKGKDISGYKSVSMSWASGGIVSTNADMLKFLKAFNNHGLVSEEMFNKMHQFTRAMPGMHYGYGLMHFNFILMPKKYCITGHSGSIGSVMYYNKPLDTYIIGSFNKVNYTRQPVMIILKILRLIEKNNL